MDHNPFISRNNDLFIMLFAGMGISLFNSQVFPLTVQQQFLLILGFGFMAGLFMTYLYQSLEWALFFTAGILIVSLFPWALRSVLTQDFLLIDMIREGLRAGKHSLFLLSSWIIAIPTGFMLQRLIMGDYYRKKTL